MDIFHVLESTVTSRAHFLYSVSYTTGLYALNRLALPYDSGKNHGDAQISQFKFLDTAWPLDLLQDM
jgi:hypothetical protein